MTSVQWTLLAIGLSLGVAALIGVVVILRVGSKIGGREFIMLAATIGMLIALVAAIALIAYELVAIFVPAL